MRLMKRVFSSLGWSCSHETYLKNFCIAYGDWEEGWGGERVQILRRLKNRAIEPPPPTFPFLPGSFFQVFYFLFLGLAFILIWSGFKLTSENFGVARHPRNACSIPSNDVIFQRSQTWPLYIGSFTYRSDTLRENREELWNEFSLFNQISFCTHETSRWIIGNWSNIIYKAVPYCQFSHLANRNSKERRRRNY